MTTDIDEFESAAGGFLHAEPVRNTALLTIARSLRVSGLDAYGDAAPYFGWYEDSGVRGVFLRTPPHAAFMSDAPAPAAESLVKVLDGAPGLTGPVDTVQAFAGAWHAATGREPKVENDMRLFRLGELTPPRPMPPGSARLAEDTDRELLAEWYAAFGDDAREPIADPEHAVERKLANGDLLLWEVDGVPVAMAGITNPIADVARIAPVYTPAALRGRGYGGAVTTATSRRALDAGLEVILFTDLANPTSNALYQRLGYRPVGDWMELALA